MLDEETGVDKQDGGGKDNSVSLIIKLYRTCNNFLQLDCRAQQHMCNILYEWDRNVKKHKLNPDYSLYDKTKPNAFPLTDNIGKCCR